MLHDGTIHYVYAITTVLKRPRAGYDLAEAGMCSPALERLTREDVEVGL
jgi:hypothetical protein